MDFGQFFDRFADVAPTYDARATATSLLLAFALGQLIAWAYSWTHVGVSYSRSFTQSLVLMTMVVALVMFVIGNNIVTAFGLLGALAIIRFRNVLKDTRDTVFVFMSLVLGLAVGSQRYEAAVVGTAALLVVVAYLHATSFGSRGHYDGHLTCWIKGADETGFFSTVRRFCRGVKQMSCRRGGGEELTEYVFQVRLRDRRRHGELVDDLRALPEVGEVAFVLRDELAEI